MTFVRRLFAGNRPDSQKPAGRSAATPSSEPSKPISVAELRARFEAKQWDTLVSSFGNPNADPALAGEHARALTLAAHRRYREARDVYVGIANQVAGWELLLDAGWCCHLLDRSEEAVAYIERGLRLKPASPELQFALAVVRLAKGEFEVAKAGLERVLADSPGYTDGWLNVAACERGLGHIDAAEVAARRAIDQTPGSPHAWAMLGLLLMAQDRADEGIAAYRRARECEVATGEDARASALLAVALSDWGRFTETIEHCERSFASVPDSTMSVGYAFALLSVGRIAEGFEQYEVRWFEDPMRLTRVRYDRPFWNGQSLAGKTIMLRAEQGIGDTIQFARYAAPLKARGANVMIHVHAGMGTLASGFVDVDTAPEVLEMPPTFDCFINMMSLPRVFGTEVESIPNEVPYLRVRPEWRAKWSARLPTQRKRVGLVWAGNPKHMRDRFRSIPAAKLAPLWGIEGIQYVCLQKELRPGDAETFPPEAVMINLAPDLADLADAAAVIDELDVLVCVDTALAHIAGALGKPVWMLLPNVADFRWMTAREDTPWYPTMRLFRQGTGGWDAVVARVAGELRMLAAGDGSVLLPRSTPVDRNGPVSPRTVSTAATAVTRFRETRDGVMQFLNSFDDEARCLEQYGEFLPRQLHVVSQLIPMDAWIVEAGSGFGSHALWMAKVIADDGHLLLYEPRPAVARILRQNLEANGLLGKVSLPRGTLIGPGFMQDQLPQPTHSIDEMDIRRLDLLKLRGPHRAAILRGSEATLWRCRPRLLLAAEDEAELDALANIAREYGYRCWGLRTPLFDDRNFNEATVDVFSGRHALALVGIPEEEGRPLESAGLWEL